ncbi:MAG TPA: methyltransferase domain-containing protein, partial [Kiloniellales bacterium]|nr:methyltransferase domain-containing protein [Kiloniellales bacterium]
MPAAKGVDLPYFDVLLKELRDGNAAVEEGFGRHVHYGYWEDPRAAKADGTDFPQAAEDLSRVMCEAAGIRDGFSVLDAGCGFGGTVAHMNERYSEMKLTGLNIDPRQLERARAKVVARPGNEIEFVEGDACKMPFADQRFDAAMAVECIFHFPSRKAFFEEARRVLKPGGTLAVCDFVPARALVPITSIRLPPKLSRGFYGSCDLTCARGDYRQLAEKTGFRILSERNITTNIRPTFRYLGNLAAYGRAASLETAALR